jgi:hypothetical protein
MDDTEGNAAVAGARDGLDLTVTYRDRLVFALDAARIGVVGTSTCAEVDEVRQLRVAVGHAGRLGGRYLGC